MARALRKRERGPWYYPDASAIIAPPLKNGDLKRRPPRRFRLETRQSATVKHGNCPKTPGPHMATMDILGEHDGLQVRKPAARGERRVRWNVILDTQ